MSNPITKIVNAKTGEEVERPMNSNEFGLWNKANLEAKALELEAIARSEARTAAEAKLLALGLTTEDLKALIG